jgi:solute carrier family 25 2-oxodicarboxylate transporter 21
VTISELDHHHTPDSFLSLSLSAESTRHYNNKNNNHPRNTHFSHTDKMTTERPLPFVYQFAAGAVAGVSEILVMYPLDVVKTRV